MHLWNYDYAGHPRKDSTLVRDCLSCGMEEWMEPPDEDSFRRVRRKRWTLNGKVYKEGLSAPPCPQTKAGWSLVWLGEKWKLRRFSGHGNPQPLVAQGEAADMESAIASAAKALRDEVARACEQHDVGVDLRSPEASP